MKHLLSIVILVTLSSCSISSNGNVKIRYEWVRDNTVHIVEFMSSPPIHDSVIVVDCLDNPTGVIASDKSTAPCIWIYMKGSAVAFVERRVNASSNMEQSYVDTLMNNGTDVLYNDMVSGKNSGGNWKVVSYPGVNWGYHSVHDSLLAVYDEFVQNVEYTYSVRPK